ncbi:uncharacterized protein LAJ45_01912 [Morchella importuna]|uniref:uncharacterized protein n=1 Tax=Morchella importuna TaxID=1174673 RepID=UPI001E8DF827|nr:uncharacterized protein LAJ45_01912 [Morchella importuna]KAH8154144.1 hypothetical protein LAJ45_01912 [Morchella importuna]
MACEACIRGHRVSGCNHSDRKLLPIAKKGRPVSQCSHCRHMRKSRSAHVKCDCGERLAFLKEQAKSGKPIPPAGACHATNEDGDAKNGASCNCCHGGRCTCSLKKEPHLDPVPELSASESCASTTPPEVRKPRLQMTQSESSLTTFANGHHRPTHKHHGSIHGSSPYTIPPVGHTGHAFGEHVNGCTKVTASASAPSTVASQKPRRIKSEQSSPDLRTYPALQMANTSITPLELTPQLAQQALKPTSSRIQPGLVVNTNHPPFTLQDFPSQELLPSAAESDSYQFSAGLYPPQSAGWPPAYGQFDPAFEDPPLDASYDTSQIDMGSFLRFQTGLAAGSVSGDEIDDFIGPPSLTGIVFDDLNVEKLLALGPTSRVNSFSTGLGLGAGVDGVLESEAQNMGLYGGYSDSFLSSKDMMVTKTAELSVLPSNIAPIDESEFLWMAPWPGSAQTGPPPPVDQSWTS